MKRFANNSLLPRRAGEKVPQADEGVLGASGTAPHPPSAPSPRKRGEGYILAILLVFATALFAQEIKVPDAEQFVGKPAGPPLTGALLDQRTNETSALLRCPVCQGMSIADSPSEMAVNMKHQVRELIARGYTQEQILRYFERSYGQFVLLKPKFQGVNTLVWILPIIALAVGAFAIFSMMGGGGQRKGGSQPVDETAATAADDDPYLAEVRKLTGKQS
jgi:cytochrome c-type biogenesis protein CcmH